jgi:predicted N-acetyltransferase YhbS
MSRAPAGLRVAGPADARALAALSRASFGTLYRGWYAPATLRAALPELCRIDPRLLASGRFRLIEEDGRALACGGWSPAAEPGCAALRHFATHPARAGRGLGAALIGRALAEIAAGGFETAVVTASLPAETFYAAHGFEALGFARIRLRCGAPFDVVEMRRPARLDEATRAKT